MDRTISPEWIGTQSGKVLMETRAGFSGAVDKAFEMVHRAAGQVVQDHQAPRLRPALLQGPVGPAVGVVPVARDRIPEHAAMLVAREIFDHGRLQQPVVEMATAAERPEPAVGVRELADRILRPADLVLCRFWIPLLPEWHRVRKSVIADP